MRHIRVFDVDTYPENFLNSQHILEENYSIDSSIHRFLLVVHK